MRQHLITREGVGLGQIEAVLSHQQGLAQTARFLRENLPGVELRSVSSTAAAVRMVSESPRPWAAVGSRAAARPLRLPRSCARGSRTSRTTSPASSGWRRRAPSRAAPASKWKTSLIFYELGDDRPGALVDALAEFSSRGINLSRIECRPQRSELGRYFFFVDLDGRLDDEPVGDAIAALRSKAESVRILGSYPAHLKRRFPARLQFSHHGQGAGAQCDV